MNSFALYLVKRELSLLIPKKQGGDLVAQLHLCSSQNRSKLYESSCNLVMSRSYLSEIAKFNQELAQYLSVANRNKQQLENSRMLAKQIVFWTESAKFLITELEIWDRFENEEKCEKSILKIQRALDRLHDLVTQLDE